MRFSSILLAAAVGIFLTNCKQQTDQSSETVTTTTDSVSPHSSDMVHDDTSKTSPILAAMEKMMDDMHHMEKTGNADYDFAASMKMHHQGAIDMSAAELSVGSDAKLKDMAKKTTEKQQKEISELDQIMAQTKGGAKNYADDDQIGKAMMDSMKSMMDMPQSTGSPDKDFAQMMVKHHTDGIMMGQAILKHAKSAKLKAMTEMMIADQKMEVKELEAWLASN